MFQWSNLELIKKCIEKYPEIEFLIVGLIRNPMDTLYSMWSRWRGMPENNQHQWVQAYTNLLRLKKELGDYVSIIRYEDLSQNHSQLEDVYNFIGITKEQAPKNYFHKKSIQRWCTDKNFGFQLDVTALTLAQKFGYRPDEMENSSNAFWTVSRHWSRGSYKVFKKIKFPYYYLRKKIRPLIVVNHF